MNPPSRFSLSNCLQPPTAVTAKWVPARDRDGNRLENAVLALFCNFAHGMLCWKLLQAAGVPIWAAAILVLPLMALVFQVLTFALFLLRIAAGKLGFFDRVSPESWGIYGYLASTTLLLSSLHEGCGPTTLVWQVWVLVVIANLLCRLWETAKSLRWPD